jgi:DNA polymerase III subunit gamma/tau
LARASEGSMRDGLSLLDQVIAFGGKTIRHQDLEALLGAVPHEHVRAMIEAVIEQQSAKALQVIAGLLDQGHDLRAYCADLVEFVRNMLVAAVVPSGPELRGLIEASDEDLILLARDAERFTVEQLQELLGICTATEDSLRVSAHPRFLLETAAVRATRLLGRRNDAAPQAAQSNTAAVDVRPSSHMPARSPDRLLPSGAAKEIGEGMKRSASKESPTAGKSGLKTPSVASSLEPEHIQAAVSSPRPLASAPASPDSIVPVVQPAITSTGSLAAEVVNWEQFHEAVTAHHPNIAPFLEMGRLLHIEGTLVTLGFPKQATSARARLENEDNLRALGALGERLYGCAVRIRIVEVADQDTKAPPTMKQMRVAKEQEQRLILTQQAKAHPLVKQALEMFGGDLAEVRTTAPAQEVQE